MRVASEEEHCWLVGADVPRHTFHEHVRSEFSQWVLRGECEPTDARCPWWAWRFPGRECNRCSGGGHKDAVSWACDVPRCECVRDLFL